MRTKRIRQKIILYLGENGPQSTAKIHDYINSSMRHGTTSQQLGNVLAKDKRFRKVGYTVKSGILSGDYEICVWGLKQESESLNG